MPPLRQRPEDIPALVAGFLRGFDHPAGRVLEITPEAMEVFLQHDWLGNVRELRNVIERGTIMCENGAIRPEDLSLGSASPAPTDSMNLDVIERRTIERVMPRNQRQQVGGVTKAGDLADAAVWPAA